MAQKACNALELKLRWKRILRKGVSPSPPDQEETLWHCVMQKVSGKALNPLNGRFLKHPVCRCRVLYGAFSPMGLMEN